MATLAEVKASIAASIVDGDPYSISATEVREAMLAICDAVETERTAVNVSATATAPLTGTTAQALLDAAAAALNGKAAVASPALTGTPSAPTADPAVSSTQLATTAFVHAAIANLVDTSPDALNTLNELAAALGDDPNFAATMTTALAGKLALTGGTMTGKILLDSDPTANLHAATKQYVDVATGGLPTGGVFAWLTGTAPTGTLECNGSAVSRTTYASLFAVIGETYGNGDGSTTFNLPDLRGYFLRGFDNGAGNDPDAASRTDRGDGTTGDNVGTKQADELKSHTHTLNNATSVFRNTGPGAIDTSSGGSQSTATISAQNTGGNETRPKNVAVMFCIKT